MAHAHVGIGDEVSGFEIGAGAGFDSLSNLLESLIDRIFEVIELAEDRGASRIRNWTAQPFSNVSTQPRLIGADGLRELVFPGGAQPLDFIVDLRLVDALGPWRPFLELLDFHLQLADPI